LTGYLPSVRDVDLTVEYDLRVVTWYDPFFMPPGEMEILYPLPSVTYGTISGYLRGTDWSGVVALAGECCGGIVGGANFQEVRAVDLWELSFLELNLGFAPFHGEVQWSFGEMPYTPEVTAVPEPTTLLLLGSGLIGAEWKRRRRAQ
jgi:hypothetical protein